MGNIALAGEAAVSRRVALEDFFRRRSDADFVFISVALASSAARRRGVPFN
jgi:hypothetical protein